MTYKPFSNGVTRSTASHADHASFLLESEIPTVVSRSTNEVWHWYASSVNNHAFDANVSIATNGPGKAFSILDEPRLPWTDSELANTNIWVSALDFVTLTNCVANATNTFDAIKNITQFLFGCHGLTYDTKFGFINKVDLVGIGECNNPFFVDASGVVGSKVRGNDDSNRSNFLNHRFVSSNSNIFDSCAGPALGTNTLAEYISSVVDISTPEELNPNSWTNVPGLKSYKAGEISCADPDSFIPVLFDY